MQERERGAKASQKLRSINKKGEGKGKRTIDIESVAYSKGHKTNIPSSKSRQLKSVKEIDG